MKEKVDKLSLNSKETQDQLDEYSDYVYFLEQEVSRLDQYGRRENIEIIGIPSSISDTKLETEVIKILRQIGLKRLEYFHIVGCHRIGKAKKNGSKNTIVRFLNRKDAISSLKKKKDLYLCKEIGYYNLSIVENLCPAYRSIFDSLIQMKNEGHVKKVWTFKGKINYLTSDDEHEKPKKIYHECELYKNFGDL